MNTNPSSDDALAQALAALVRHTQALAATDGYVRAFVGSLGEVLVQIAAQAEATSQQASAAPITPVAESQLLAQPTLPQMMPLQSIQPIAANSQRSDTNDEPTWQPVTLDELPIIERRCRLKAEAARWTLERASLLEQGAPFAEAIMPRDTDLIEQAREFAQCYLWMFQREAPAADKRVAYTELAGCYEAAANALQFVRTLLADQATALLLHGLTLCAEAQSALRVAVQELGRNSDRDQIRLFMWLKEYGYEQNIFIERFMRASDIAAPEDWPDVCGRIDAAASSYRAQVEGQRRKRKLLNKAIYHRQQILSTPGDEHAHDWQKVLTTVDELLGDGLPASSIELRELLLPLTELVPEQLELSYSVQRVMNEIDSYLASRPTNVLGDLPATESRELAQARQLLRGQALVMIGGERRIEAEQQLKAALNVNEIYWIDTRSHQTHTVFEPYVARGDVALVLLAIRWASHGFSEVQAFCTRYNKPLVRLPTGYNANQVAYQIVTQVSGMLENSKRQANG